MALPILKCSFVLASDLFKDLSGLYEQVGDSDGWGFTFGDAPRTLVDPETVFQAVQEHADDDWDDDLAELKRRLDELPEGCYIDFEN